MGMTVDIATGTHAKGYPSNVLAQRSGEHVYSVRLSSNTDNGNLVAIGDWADWDVFTEAAVTTFTGKIVAKNPDGTWLVLVTDPGDAGFVYTKPLSPYTEASLRGEKTMYNKAGDVARVYGLHKHDRISVSDEGFTGTPAVGATISSVAAKKMVIASAQSGQGGN